MAIDLHLLEREFDDGDNDTRNGIRSMLVAIDDAVDTTDAAVQARGATLLNANGFNVPSDYFTSNRQIAVGDQSLVFDAAGDFAVFGKGGKLAEVIA